MNIAIRASVFLKEVLLEIKKVNWPARKETIRYTLIVIGVSLAVALYLGLLDTVFNSAFNEISNLLKF